MPNDLQETWRLADPLPSESRPPQPLPAAEAVAASRPTSDCLPLDSARSQNGSSGGAEFSGAADDFFLGPSATVVTDRFLGRTLGGVHIEEKIGSGGMGTVYRGRQLKTGKEVAVKVVRPEFGSPRALERFEFEAQILGKLDHPGLVRILHADTYADGSIRQPFFVMELVAGGQPLGEFAAAVQPNERSWMAIFAEVCEAVAAAHARGIVHRDLKPGNILIDGAGRPRVIDFGVALVRDPALSADQPTEDGSIGTPAFMSPEQAAGQADDIDVTTDVYALGVVMYERLSGAMPYEVRAVTDAARVINEVAPIPLATASPGLSRDVCTIVMKCLSKERAGRYSSAAELEADIRRFLADQAIVAAPPTLSDSLRRFCRRHRLLAAAAATIMLTLVSSLVIVSAFYLEARWQKAEVTRLYGKVRDEKEISDSVLEMLVTTLGRQPPQTVAETAYRRDLLLGAAAAADTAYPAAVTPRQQAIKAGFLTAIGRSLLAIGDPQAARDQLRLARQTLESGSAVGNDQLWLVCLHNLSHAAIEAGDFREAIEAAAAAAAIASRLRGPLDTLTMQVKSNEAMARMVMGELAEAARLTAEIEQYLAGQLPQFHPDLATAASNHGEVLQRRGELNAAEQLQRTAVGIWARQAQHDDPREGTSLNNLGEVLRQTGRHDEAEQVHQKALALHRETLPAGHFLISTSLSKLAEVCRVTGRLTEAEQLLEEALTIRKNAGLDHHSEAALLHWRLGLVHEASGRTATAVTHARVCYELRAAGLGKDHPDTLAAEAMARRLEGHPDVTASDDSTHTATGGPS